MRNEAAPKAIYDRDIENGDLYLGQVAALVREAKPAVELVEDIINDYNAVINKLPPF